MRTLWECPRCGRRFANVRQWHSCGNPDLAALLAEASDHAVAIYDEIAAVLLAGGGARVHPQKTRIAFISRMTFASVRLARRWADLDLIVEGPIDDARIRRIELYGPTSFGHQVRITETGEVDDDLRGWLRRARRRGDQETLDPRAHVDPVVGRPLEVLHVPLRSRVVRHGPALALRVPRYAAEALDAHPRVVARLGRDRHPGTIEGDGERSVLVLDTDTNALGLGEGDAVDVYLTADL